jgi:hypothetical protein
MKTPLTLSGLLCLLVLSRPSFGQQAEPDPLLASSIEALRQQYTASFAGLPQLFNAPEYADYTKAYHASIGHQFFLAPEKQPGSVYYNGYLYPNLRLSYDVVRDQLLLAQPASPVMLQLIGEKVGYFFIAGHHFIRLAADSAAAAIRPGYYEVLADGSSQVLAKRGKRMQQQVINHYIDVRFNQLDKLFIKKAGVYYPVNKKAVALRVFSDRSKEVQRYIQEHQLKFNKAQLEASLVELALYYNSQPPQQ